MTTTIHPRISEYLWDSCTFEWHGVRALLHDLQIHEIGVWPARQKNLIILRRDLRMMAPRCFQLNGDMDLYAFLPRCRRCLALGSAVRSGRANRESMSSLSLHGVPTLWTAFGQQNNSVRMRVGVVVPTDHYRFLWDSNSE